MSKKYLVVAAMFILVPVGLAIGRLESVDERFEDLLPRRAYEVQTLINFDSHGSAVNASTFLPIAGDLQQVFDEMNSSPGLALEVQNTDGNRQARWSAAPNHQEFDIIYSYRVVPRGVKFVIPEGMPIPERYAARLAGYLEPTESVQSTDPAIATLLDEIAPEPRHIRSTLMAIQRYTADELDGISFKGTTDALTALRLGRASCNGRSRLFVALARRAGIPARLVGGIILNEGTKRTSHQWVEAWVNGHWVTFCPTNGYVAETPEKYLTLYRGDRVLFSHSTNINFDYAFKVKRTFLAAGQSASADSPMIDFWTLFRQLGIPLEILKIILMLPVGATVLVVLRNVIGIQTYGIFLPILIAAAARNTGVYWGLLGFSIVLTAAIALRMFLGRFTLLHTPKLAILFTFVIGLLMAMGVLGARLGLNEIAHVSLFPIAILTMTTERVVNTIEEQDLFAALKVLLPTFVAVYICYQVMDSSGLQALLLGFPELLLITVGLNILLAQWVGIRFMEYVRFRRLIFRGAQA